MQRILQYLPDKPQTAFSIEGRIQPRFRSRGQEFISQQFFRIWNCWLHPTNYWDLRTKHGAACWWEWRDWANWRHEVWRFKESRYHPTEGQGLAGCLHQAPAYCREILQTVVHSVQQKNPETVYHDSCHQEQDKFYDCYVEIQRDRPARQEKK